MKSSERVRRALEGRRPDRIPVHEDFWSETLDVWKTQGLPDRLTLFPPEDPGGDLKDWAEDHFDFDLAVMFLDASPRLPQEVLSRDGDWYTYRDRWGYTAKKPQGRSGTIEYTETFTKSREDWNALAPLFTLDTDDAARIDDRNYFEHFTAYPTWAGARRKFDRLRQRGRYLLFKDYGPWEGTWRHREFTAALMDLVTDPGWLKDMARAHHDLRRRILDTCLAEGMKPDGFFLVDDLGSSHGPLISPDMFRSILKPFYADLGSWLNTHGIDFWLHSCGNTELFIEDYLECGVRVLNPLQVSAGMDAMTLRDRYGDRLAFYGNIDAHLLDGDPAVLEKEVRRRRDAFREGGWVYHSDHSVPPTMAYTTFEGILRLLRDEA